MPNTLPDILTLAFPTISGFFIGLLNGWKSLVKSIVGFEQRTTSLPEQYESIRMPSVSSARGLAGAQYTVTIKDM